MPKRKRKKRNNISRTQRERCTELWIEWIRNGAKPIKVYDLSE